MQTKIIDLCGTWKIKGATSDRGGVRDWPRDTRWMPTYDAPVPGSVQEAMEFVTGDVHSAHNVYNARFIEEQFWLYSRSFVLEEADLAGDNRVRLVFEGLDLNAVIYVNDREVGRHANFYTPCRVDVTAAVHPGENRLAVRLESGIYAYSGKDTSAMHGNDVGRQLRRMYMRKPQSAFEWDWSPRLLNVGIYKPCHLEIAPFFANEASVFHDLNDDYSQATVRIRQFLSLPAERRVSVSAKIGETGEGATWVGTVAGEQYAPLTFTVDHPTLWQPRNHGTPYRYTLTITVRDEASGAIISETSRKIGLRHVVIDQSPRPQGGRYFKLIVNGHKLFAKGGNMIPADILFSKLDRAAYEVLIDRAFEDNFNALRVWGGGIYESDDFYDLCDERGMIVWQDFIGACATYPAADPAFHKNYIGEVAYEIRRLSQYASLVIYAGNNEIDQFMANVPSQHYYTDAALYYYTLPMILRQEGDNHYYQPSSPCSPEGIHPCDFSVGDQHPWDIGFRDRDYFKYRTYDCRFPNEGGILGPTSLPNMMAALGEGQEYMHSFDFKVHDNSICDMDDCAPERLLFEKLGMDIEQGQMSLPDYVYYGGFLQGEGLTEYILNFRRRMNDTTCSAIFWMYNDCWPATRSWTTVDYLRNRTPSFWPVKRAFAPVALDIVVGENGLDVYGINEYLEAREAKLVFGMAGPDGADLHLQEEAVTLEANTSTVLLHMDGPLPAQAIPFAELYVDGRLVARRRFVDKPYNTLGLRPSEIRVTVDGDTATYVSDSFVFGVCLDLDGEDGALSDNYFDLYPSRPYTVKLGKQSGRVLYAYMGNA